MDFLDPRKRRSHKYRLMVGYLLMAVVIGLSSYLLFNAAYGFGYNTKTGQVIENGLVYIDSKPGGADVYLNGQKQSSKTAARVVVPSGNYSLSITKQGYRSWQRSFTLDEHTVARFVYPFLFPAKPLLVDLKSYAVMPGLLTQSPDRHWLLVQEAADTSTSFILDQYDTGSLAKGAQPLSFPKTLLANGDPSGLKEVEWSSDNKHVLLEHTLASGHEFIVLDRTAPDQSFNVNKLFTAEPTQVALRDKKVDQLYLYNQADQSLQIGDAGQATLLPVFLKHILAFKPYGQSLLTYVTDTDTKPGEVSAHIWDNGQIYLINKFAAGSKYLIDAAQFQNHWYYLAGSDKSDRVNIYKDPISNIKNPLYGKAVPMLALSVTAPAGISFSDNARFIGLQGGQDFAVYDMETASVYHYSVKSPLTAPLQWMDGHRWIGQTAGSVYVVDYDNTNEHSVTPTSFPGGAFFSRDYNQMITIAPSADATKFVLQRVDMRAGTDLPADHSQ